MPSHTQLGRVFLSHSSKDTLAAKAVKDVLGRAGLGDTFLDVDDIHPGAEWSKVLREALEQCDSLITLLTPEFAQHHWMSAEWACFWFARKPCFTLRLHVPLADVFPPMRDSQSADVGSVSGTTDFLDAVLPYGLENNTLARRLVTALARARTTQQAADLTTGLDEVVHRQGVVPKSRIRELVDAGAATELAEIYMRANESGANLSRVRLFQIAEILQATGTHSRKLIGLTSAIGNSNYQRDIVIHVLQSAEPAEDKRAFARKIYPTLTAVARQKVKYAATEAGVELGQPWEDVTPMPF